VKGKAPPLHVYLSPHLDDAVLSCGGAIHRQVSAGEPVLVITFFAGEPPAEPSLSPFALVQHGYWGNPLRPMDLRRAEDKAALTLLGAEAKHLDFLDAVYRVGVEGEWLYAGEEAIFGEVQPADPLMINGAQVLVDCLVDLIPHEDRRVVYAPLGQAITSITRSFTWPLAGLWTSAIDLLSTRTIPTPNGRMLWQRPWLPQGARIGRLKFVPWLPQT
jgi:LmbE family N-acetylglucosaminyl deacetylase